MPNWSRGFLLICARAACTYSSVDLPFISMPLSMSRGSEFTRECPAFYCSLCIPFYSHTLPPFWPVSWVIFLLFICHVWEKAWIWVVWVYICVMEKRGSPMKLIVLWRRGYLGFKEDRDRKSMKEELVKGKIWSFLCGGGRKVSRSPQIRHFVEVWGLAVFNFFLFYFTISFSALTQGAMVSHDRPIRK